MTKGKIGILTGGGDCPGLNAVIRSVAKSAINMHGLEVVGIRDGFLGLIEGLVMPLTSKSVSGILTQGGTILGTSNKENPFAYVTEVDGKKQTTDVSGKCIELYDRLGLEALICLGGDGTLTLAGKLAEKGANIVGVPKTIDRDLMETDNTFGFDSARSMATEAVDRLHATAASHHRVMLVEVMGRNAGWLALEACVAGGGDIALIPEIPYDLKEVCQAVDRRNVEGKRFSIIVVSEGARPAGGSQVYQHVSRDGSQPARLGGCSQIIAQEIEEATGIECRVTVLGHLQRGGTPTPYDRLLATQFGVHALELVVSKKFNTMVALKGSEVTEVPIKNVMGKQRVVPLDCPLVHVAKAVGTSFGEKLIA
jgi:ATP-dependent phosphofructokinase / diphosphate-dependent phosphofructokinase